MLIVPDLVHGELSRKQVASLLHSIGIADINAQMNGRVSAAERVATQGGRKTLPPSTDKGLHNTQTHLIIKP